MSNTWVYTEESSFRPISPVPKILRAASSLSPADTISTPIQVTPMSIQTKKRSLTCDTSNTSVKSHRIHGMKEYSIKELLDEIDRRTKGM